jgi:hypothetical protein
MADTPRCKDCGKLNRVGAPYCKVCGGFTDLSDDVAPTGDGMGPGRMRPAVILSSARLDDLAIH